METFYWLGWIMFFLMCIVGFAVNIVWARYMYQINKEWHDSLNKLVDDLYRLYNRLYAKED